MKYYSLLAFFFFCCIISNAVCPAGQVEVTIQVHTDDYGYEGYWQLVPTGNTCGTGTIFSGGNTAVGCNGGGQQNVTSGGYANNAVITEGPWCLTQGSSYDIIFVDDFGDGGTIFTVYIDGLPLYTGLSGSGDAPGTRLTFLAQGAPAADASSRKINNFSYVNPGNIDLKVWVANLSSTPMNSITLSYKVDNSTVQSAAISGLNVAPFDSVLLTHTTPWTVTIDGEYNVTMWTSNPNGMADVYHANDSAHKLITVGPPIPNIIDDYIGVAPILTEIGSTADSIVAPSDLDFHPVLSRYELWVTRRDDENSGGSTVRFNNAGKADQRFIWQRDGNAWHFMSLPTGIAFSENENFATSPAVFNANHNGGVPFTGPTLWSSDTTIYSLPSGGNGSHLDMLHQSPYCMGICSEGDNKFWVFDDNDQDIVYYDFVKDHGPGNSDHSDGVIRRYGGMGLASDPQHEIPSHLILDKKTNILYVVDTDNDRVITMDITSGTMANSLTPYEPVAEYTNWTGATWSVFADSGLTTPCGIDQIDNRLIVSDYATGDIVIYEINTGGASGTEIGRIVTGTPGIMGIKIGPDGKIWYVNALTNQVVRIDGLSVGIKDHTANNFSVYPNPATDKLNVLLNGIAPSESNLTITDMKGALVYSGVILKGEKQIGIDVSGLSSGIYSLSVRSNENVIVKKFVRE